MNRLTENKIFLTFHDGQRGPCGHLALVANLQDILPWTNYGQERNIMDILELANQMGLAPKWVAGTNGGEYHSSCPDCGGKDRFFIQPHRQMSKCLGSYRCRRCGISGDTIQFAIKFLDYSFKEALEGTNSGISERMILFVSKPNRISKYDSLQSPPKQWLDNATNFVECAHKILLKKDDILEYLSNRGLPLEAVRRYKLGWSDNNEFLSRNSWGLKEQFHPDNRPRKLWIPKGLVIPTIEGSGTVVRLKIRRFDWQEGDKLPKYVAITGSMNGLNLVGSSTRNIMIVVESELDAFAIDNVANDFALTVAVGSNIKNPDNLTDSCARKSNYLLIVHDNDEAGQGMLTKWKKLYTHAKSYPTPIGKDIGDAIKNGLDIRQWILQALPNNFK